MVVGQPLQEYMRGDVYKYGCHFFALTHPIQLNHMLCGRNMSIVKIWLNNNFPNTQFTNMY